MFDCKEGYAVFNFLFVKDDCGPNGFFQLFRKLIAGSCVLHDERVRFSVVAIDIIWVRHLTTGC